MRIKLTNLIIVSLISLSFIFSAISNSSAAYSKSVMSSSNTTSASGWTVYQDNKVEPEAVTECKEQYAWDAATCLAEEQLLGGGREGDKDSPNYIQCMIDIWWRYATCMCDAGSKLACFLTGWGIEKTGNSDDPFGHIYPDTLAQPMDSSLSEKFDKFSPNAQVEEKLAPAVRSKTTRRMSPIIKARAGVVK